MKQIILTLFCFLFLSFSTSAQQKQGAWWYFGNKAGVNFNTQPPSPDYAGQSRGAFGCASVSDANGNLLFYADGSNVYNKLHQIMPNGATLNLPGRLFDANVMIVQKPGNNFLYYIFSVTPLQNPASPNFTYSIIDMRLDGGKGDVVPTSKTISVFPTPIAAKLTAAMHANNQDVWVIVHSKTGNNYYSFLISSNGIGPPVTTSVGAPNASGNTVGVMKSSPNSTLIADAATVGKYTQLLDFDRNSGTLSNVRTFSFSGNSRLPYGVAFSPDNSKLYLSDVRYAYQYNLLAGSFPAVLASKTILNPNLDIGHYDIQLGLNGKLYLTTVDSTGSLSSIANSYLSVINCPNALGNACGYQDTAIYLGQGKYGGLYLPALNQTLFRNANFLQLTATQNYVCIGDSIKLSAFGAGVDQFTWLPANGITPKNRPEIWVKPTTTTTYTVIGVNQCGISDTVSLTVPVVPPAYANAGPNKIICTTGSVQLGASAQPGFTYAWNSSPFLTDTTLANPTFTATNTTTSDQVYQLILTIDGPGVSCGKRTDTVQVTVKPQILANAGAAVSFCSGTTIQLNPQQFNASYTYFWLPATGLSNANTFAPSLTLSNFSAQPDTVFYTLTATKDGCSASSQVRVVVLPEPKPVIYGPASVCPGSPQIAYAVQNHQSGTTYSWGVSGGTIQQTFSDSIRVSWGVTSATAKIWVKAQNSFSCQSDTVFFPVIINPLLATEKPKGNDTLCTNDKLNQLYQIARAQGSVYNWGIAGGTLLSGQGSHQIRVNWNGTGQHKLWVQESAQTSLAQCFGVSDTLRISVLPSPDTTLVIQGPASVCDRSTQIYTFAGNPGSYYSWQIVGGSIITGVGTNTIGVNWRTAGPGEIKVLETLPNGCESVWRRLPVQVNPLPTPFHSTTSSFCRNALTQTYQIHGMSGSTFQWSVTGGTLLSGQGTDQVSILWDSLATSHFHSVIETTVYGCTSSASSSALFDRSELKLLSVGLDEAEENLKIQYQMKNRTGGQNFPISIMAENKLNGQWQSIGQSPDNGSVFLAPFASFDQRNYQLQGSNLCGNGLFSGIHQPVKLLATGNENSGEVKLTWNSYKGWQDTVKYEVWQKLEGQAQFSKLTATSDTSLTLKTGRDGFQQRYRIKAVSKTGYQSWSNSVGLTFENALDFPNVITPNNDGLNETFTAKSLLLYPNSSLKIYNRWGQEVYLSPNYQGDWKAQGLSSGTYYYLFQTKDGKSFKGWVEVIRD